MRKTLLAAILLVGGIFLWTADSQAESAGVLSELRVGVLAHDVPILGFNRESGPDINAEVLFVSPDVGLFRAIGEPRPHLGASVNTQGDTSLLYAGLTWDWQLPQNFFVEAMFGGAVHDGELDDDDDDRKALGSRVLFRGGASLGYHITEKVNFSFMFEHASNANLADRNQGIDNFGLRIGYRF